jgi:ligand-binding SRPBCC domain-containing protein
MSIRITSREGGYRLEAETTIPRSREEVFRFFSDCRNLELLTPRELEFRILTADPYPTRSGLLIDYRLKLHGIPFRWQSEITAWDPPLRFVDEQKRGPYRRWVHEHRFTEGEGGTVVSDRVDYVAPGGPLIHRWFVEPKLRRIFEYRAQQLKDALA